MRKPALVAAAAAIALLAARGAAGGGEAFSLCTSSQLTGRFAVIRGSAGAGNVGYRLTVRNQSARTCAVTGVPLVRLLGRGGRPLPTLVRPAFPGAATAVLVILAPRRQAHADARFSPDVPGVGESGRVCEPTAYRLRVSARGGGAFVVPVRPPTPVCEHGRLSFTSFTRG